MKGSKTVDLTTGNVWKILLLYSLPLFGSAMVQQFYSLVDLLVVGNFAQEGALAVDAIGNATVVVNILISFALGVNGGCSVTVAKHFGQHDNKRLRETMNTAVISFSVLCLLLMVVGFSCDSLFLKLLSVQPSYYNDCLTYLNIYLGSLPFVFFYNLGCGICSALGDSKSPFIFLIISSVLNIGLDLLFVCVFKWDVAGAAWATFISQTISCLLTMYVLFRKLKTFKSEEKPKLFDKVLLKDLTVTSLPVILQYSFVSVGNFFVNKRINMMGEDATTGFTTAFKLICMANMGVSSMTNGLANFCSQNKAAGKYDRIKQGYFVELCYSLITSIAFLILFVSCPEFLTGVFVQQDKLTEQAMAYSVRYLTIVSCFLPVVCTKIISDGVVRGSGGNLGFTVSTFADLGLRVLLVYVLTDVGWGFDGVCWAWAFGWSISMLIAIGFLLLMLHKLGKLKKQSQVQ